MADNTIEALRINSVGIEGVKATGTLTMPTQPTAGDTTTIGGIVYTWRAIVDTDAAGEISIGADLPAAKLAFVAAVNGLDAFNVNPNPYVSAGTFAGNVSTLTARIPGPFGNTITLTETFTAVGNVFNGVVLGVTVAGSMARGTPVVATARLAVEDLAWSDEDEKVYNSKVANGILTRNRGRASPVQHGTQFSLGNQAMIWEQLLLFLAMTVDGVPTLTGPAGGPFVWTFNSDPTANPNPLSVTMERRLSTGLGTTVNVDVIDERASYGMLSELGLQFAVNEDLKLSGAAGFARKFESMGGGITSGLTLPEFEVGVSALSTVYLDPLWANVGVTLLAEQVIGWNWKFNPGIFPRHTAEGRTSLDFTKHQLNGGVRGIDIELMCLLEPARYALELARAADPATNQFAVRIKVVGSDGRELLIDQLMQHNKPLWAPSVDEGQDVVQFAMSDLTDSTNFLRVQVTVPDQYTLA